MIRRVNCGACFGADGEQPQKLPVICANKKPGHKRLDEQNKKTADLLKEASHLRAMSRGLGKMQRAILAGLEPAKRAHMRGKFDYLGAQVFSRLHDEPTLGWSGTHVTLGKRQFDLRATLRYLALGMDAPTATSAGPNRRPGASPGVLREALPQDLDRGATVWCGGCADSSRTLARSLIAKFRIWLSH